MKAKFRSLLKSPVFWILFITLANLFIYLDLLRLDPLLAFDDHLILDPLIELVSLKDYIHAFIAGRIVDIQPIRDFSLLFDLLLKGHISFWSFHLTNVLIWISTVIVFYQIAKETVGESETLLCATILLSAHPVVAISVSWIAARKHLLSVFFIGCATLLTIYCKKRPGPLSKLKSIWVIVIPCLYLLAVFSHPIGIFWPIWAVVFLWEDGRKNLSIRQIIYLIASMLLVMIGCIKLNYDYYSGRYFMYYAVEKLSSDFDISSALLAIGRYTFNIFLPGSVSVKYYPGTVQNFIGLVLLPLVLWATVKKSGLRMTFIWGLMIAFPLLTVIGRQKNVFVSDTYLLIPLIGLLILSVSMLHRIGFQFVQVSLIRRTSIIASVCLIFGFFVVQSRLIAISFQSERLLWDRAYAVERTPSVVAQQITLSIESKQYSKAFELAQELKEWSPSHPLLPRLLSKSVYYFDRWSIIEKTNYLESQPMNDPWYFYYLAGLYAGMGDYSRAYRLLSPMTSYSFRYEEEAATVAAELTYFCVKSIHQQCGKISKSFEAAINGKATPWRQETFLKRLKELDVEVDKL